jgi:hypothetical protein
MAPVTGRFGRFSLKGHTIVTSCCSKFSISLADRSTERSAHRASRGEASHLGRRPSHLGSGGQRPWIESHGGLIMNWHYIEPIGWLLVCLLFIVALAVIVAPLGMDSRQPALQQAFDPKALESTSK